MRNLFLASVAALALAGGATTVLAQNTSAPTSSSASRAMTADQKTAYDGWPTEYRAYYDTLTENQKTGWFALTDAQRKQVYELPAPQKAQAWASIEQQLAAAAPGASAATAAGGNALPSAASTDEDAANPSGSAAPDASATAEQLQANPRGEGPATATPPNPADADSAVAPAMPADPGYNAGPYKGALTAPPADAMSKSYPLCTRKIQDSCRNRGGV